METMKNAVIYARVSSYGKRQDTERQVLDLQEYAEKNGYNILKIVEEHVSGAKKATERQLDKLVKFAQENKCTILVSELSRVGRNISDVMQTIQQCLDNSINMYIQKDNLNLIREDGTKDFTAQIIISVLAMVAQYERENISFRLNSGRERKIRESGFEGFGRPKGRTETDKELRAKPGYEKAIKLIKEGRSYSSIIAELRGQETPVHITQPTLTKLKRRFCK